MFCGDGSELAVVVVAAGGGVGVVGVDAGGMVVGNVGS